MAELSAIIGWMASLSEGIRARALRLLEKQELSVAELCEVMQLPQSTVSRHLKVLMDDGWIRSRREGTSRYYSLSETLSSVALRIWSVLREEMDQENNILDEDERLQHVLIARQSRSKEFFSSSSGQWDKLREELFGTHLNLLVLAGLLDENWIVGDLGCGTGCITESLSPFVRKVVGIDSSVSMLAAARTRTGTLPNVEILQGDMETLPLKDSLLDAVLAVLVLHHLAEPLRLFQEIARVLKPGGKALLVDMQPHDRQEYRQQMGHVWLGFSPSQLEKWLQDAGLAPLRINPLPSVPLAKGPPLFFATAIRPSFFQHSTTRNK